MQKKYKIGLITYDKPHKKSIDLFFKLLSNNYTDITILVVPFKNYKIRNTKFKHRPSMTNIGKYGFSTLKSQYNLKIKKLKSIRDYDDLDVVLIGGSNILPSNLIIPNLIINCHSGLIPSVRGLDSFKWAIHDKEIIGNTLHYIDEYADMGKVIAQRITYVDKNDTLEGVAQRHYDSEIDMLSNFENLTNNGIYYVLPKKKIKKRMDNKTEEKIFKRFDEYKKNFKKLKLKFEKKFQSATIFHNFSNEVKNVSFGKNCTIVQPVNMYGCKLGNNVFIGPFVEITKGVKIGNDTRISSHSFLCELVKIGSKCFIAHGVMFINDTFSSGNLGGSVVNWKSTNIGNKVLIGTNSTILPVEIIEGCVIGAGSVVTKDCKIKGVYAGNPAKLIRKLK